MKPSTLDLRQRIIDTYESNEGTIRQIAQRFKVSISSVRRLIKRYLSTGSIAPKPYTGGNKPKLKAEHLEILATLISEDNDATNFELAQRIFDLTGVEVSIWTIGRGLKKLNITKKKKTFKAAEVYTESKQLQRYVYWNIIKDIKVEDLVFLDETGVNLAMVSFRNIECSNKTLQLNL